MALQLTFSGFLATASRSQSLHTCEGQDVSPSLAWSGVPAQTQSLVLIIDDPDAPDPNAPRMTWVHWVVYDIPLMLSRERHRTGHHRRTGQRALRIERLETHRVWLRVDRIGRHRYFHKLYALDCMLGDLGQPTKAGVERAMHGHILAEAVLIGTYQKST